MGVNVAPIIPGLNDEEIPEILSQSAKRGAASATYILLRLPYSIKDMFINWLEREFPDRKDKILNKIREMRGGKLNVSDFGKRFKGQGKQANAIRDLFYIGCRKYHLNERDFELNTTHFKRPSGKQIELF